MGDLIEKKDNKVKKKLEKLLSSPDQGLSQMSNNKIHTWEGMEDWLQNKASDKSKLNKRSVGFYIQEYLEKEILYSYKDKVNELRNLPDNVEWLIVLVGLSPEPLIQLIYLLQPKKICFLINDCYELNEEKKDGYKVQDDWEAYLSIMKENKFIENDLANDIFFEVSSLNSPHLVYEKMIDVKKKYINNSQNVYIDITGSKKSMVVGTFLFAAREKHYITYVDFKKYDEVNGRPYGYTCYVNFISNPYEIFKIKEWEQIEFLYEKFNFSAAKEYFEKYIEKELSNQQLKEKINRFKCLIDIYDYWQNGNMREALYKYKNSDDKLKKSIHVPIAVTELGDDWPFGETIGKLHEECNKFEGIDNNGHKVKPYNSFYLKPRLIRIYAKDELAKIENLIHKKEDYRAGFLRAMGLFDLLQKVRLIHCFVLEILDFEKNNNISSYNPYDLQNKEFIFKRKLITFSNGAKLFEFLSNPKNEENKLEVSKKNGLSIFANGINKDVNYQVLNSGQLSQLKQEGQFKHFWKMRHKSIHAYASVNKKIADDAYWLASTNYENLLVFFKDIKEMQKPKSSEGIDKLMKKLLQELESYESDEEFKDCDFTIHSWKEMIKKIDINDLTEINLENMEV